MKTNLVEFKMVIILCFVAVISSSCNDSMNEDVLVQDQERVELESIAKQYDLTLSRTDPNAKNMIRVSSVQAFRDTLAKHYAPTDLAKQARWEVFVRSLLDHHLGANFPPEVRAQFDSLNAIRVSKLLKMNVADRRRFNEVDKLNSDRSEFPGAVVSNSVEKLTNRTNDHFQPFPPDDEEMPDPEPPYTGPDGPTGGPIGTYPGGPVNGGDWELGDPEAYSGEPATFEFGDVSGTLFNGTHGGKPIKVGFELYPSDPIPQLRKSVMLQIFFDYKKEGDNIVGAEVSVTAPGDESNQVRKIPYASEGYSQADGTFFVMLVMTYEWTPIGITFPVFGVNPTVQSKNVRVVFYIDKYGRPTQVGARTI
jgi:hypothetical protein